MLQEHYGIKKIGHCEGRKQTKIKIDLFLHLRNNNVHPLEVLGFALSCFILGFEGKPWHNGLEMETGPGRPACRVTVRVEILRLAGPSRLKHRSDSPFLQLKDI